VLPDDATALLWLNLAIAGSERSAPYLKQLVAARDAVAARMTTEQVAAVKQRELEWTPARRWEPDPAAEAKRFELQWSVKAKKSPR
jgi:hypothetical protein